MDRVGDIKTFVIVSFELFSSLNAEEGSRPRPTQPVPLPHKQEGKSPFPSPDLHAPGLVSVRVLSQVFSVSAPISFLVAVTHGMV